MDPATDSLNIVAQQHDFQNIVLQSASDYLNDHNRQPLTYWRTVNKTLMPIRTVGCNLGAERRCLSSTPDEYCGIKRPFHPHKLYIFMLHREKLAIAIAQKIF